MIDLSYHSLSSHVEKKVVCWQSSHKSFIFVEKLNKIICENAKLQQYTIFRKLDLLKESSRIQILNVNRRSNHPSTTKPRPQVKQARLPTKTAVVLGPSY